MAHMGALGLAALLALAAGDAAAEISGNVVKIGVLNDQSGLYADRTGQGSVAAARMAVEDFGEVGARRAGRGRLGRPPEQARCRRRDRAALDRHRRRRRDRRPPDLFGGAGRRRHRARAATRPSWSRAPATARLTGDACSPMTVHWTYDTWALAHGTGKAVVEAGGTSWFFLTADYVFGHDLEAQTAEVVRPTAARCWAPCATRSNTPDFSSFLQQAKASGAKVVGLANAGGDTINAIKQAARVRPGRGRPAARGPAR